MKRYKFTLATALILAFVAILSLAAPKRVTNVTKLDRIMKLNQIEQDIGMDLDVYLSDAQIDQVQNVPDIRERLKKDAKLLRFLLNEYRKNL